MIYSKITGTGSYLPEQVLTNSELEKIVDTTDEWIRSRTGIEKRHVARDDETTCDLAEKASRAAIKMAGKKENDIDLIKRVIALPNDKVDIRNQNVYVNDLIQKRGIGLTSPKNTFPITVDNDCIFVLGDNRNLSNDSRAFGCVPIENIKGNLALRLWPIRNIKLFR